MREINTVFSYLWHYSERTEADLQEQCKLFSQKYQSDVSATDISDKRRHLKTIHMSNFGSWETFSVYVTQQTSKFKLEDVLCNI